MTTLKEHRFEVFFKDPLYLLYKNHLYNFLVRRFVVRNALKGKGFMRVLEVGCGISPMTGASTRSIRTDLSWQALSVLESSGAQGGENRSVACSATELPFQTNSVDCVVCSEVLEHIENDEKVLGEIYRVLEPDGELCLTGPVHQKYFGFDDKFVGHYRRYEIPDLVKSLQEKGFKEIKVEPVLGSLEKLIMENMTKVFSRLRKEEESAHPLGVLSRIAAWLALPFYLVVNYCLAPLVFLQGRAQSLENVVTVRIECRK